MTVHGPRLLALAVFMFAVVAAAPDSARAQDEAAAPAPLHTIPSDLKLLGDPIFTADGKRFAYMAQGEGKSWVVIDGERGEGTLFRDSPVFSADGKHVAFRAGKRVSATAEKWWIVLDGRKLGTHDWVGPPAITADGAKAAYWAGKGVKLSAAGPYEGGSYSVVFGKKKGASYPEGAAFERPVISPDGKQVAYAARDSRYWLVVVGKKTSRKYGLVGRPGFGPRGRRYAYPVFDNARWFLVDHKNKEGKQFDFVSTPVFAPKGKKIAARVKASGKWFVVLNGKTLGDGFDSIGEPLFSPDGKQVAYRANRGGELDFEPLPGMPGPPPGTETLVKGGKWLVVVGSTVVSEEHEKVGDPVFSPDAKSIAFPAFDGKAWRIVVDHKSSEAHEWVSRPVYAPDGKSVGYGARNGKQLRWLTMPVN